MFNRDKLDRERLEIYYTHVLLASRPIFFICGLLFLICSAGVFIANPYAGTGLLIVAIILSLLSQSFRLIRLTARLAVWVAMYRRN